MQRVLRSSELEVAASGRSRGNRHGGIPDVPGLKILDNGDRTAEDDAENGDGDEYVRFGACN